MININIFELFGKITINEKEAIDSINKVETEAGKADKGFGGIATTIGSLSTGLLALGGTAVVALGGLSIKSALEFNSAMGDLQIKTGASNEEMKKMSSIATEIYNQGLGENIEEVNNALALMNGLGYKSNEELKNMSENALLLSSTLGYDVTESTRSADMLIKQFGLTADEAFGLIAQGAQNGLDKNGDLLDTINEYSPQFQQLGFTADEMMNMMVNAVDNGAFSVDKAGDAIKEFNIRVKDGSTTTNESFASLGLNADTMAQKFSIGGASASQAFTEVMTKLSEIKDPIQQNTIGVGLFGTQWEDLGSKAVLAMSSTGGVIDATKPTIESINSIKFDSFGSAIEGIKRNFETGILIPLGNAVLPILNQLANWMMQYMPIIQATVKTAMDSITELFTGTSDNLNSGFMDSLKKMYEWIKPYIPEIQDFFTTAFDLIKSVIENLAPPIMSLVESTFPVLQEAIGFIVENVLPPLTEIFEYIANELIPLVGDIFEKLAPRIQAIMLSIWTFIEPVLNDIVTLFNWAWPTISEAVSIAVENIGNIIDGLLSVIQGILDFVQGVFTGDWELAWKGVKEIFSGVFNSLASIVKSSMNGVINLVNAGIRALNQMKFTLPDIMGGGSVGLNISTIPPLKDGGNITRGGTVLVGEEGPEFLNLPRGASVTPLDNKTKSIININISGNSIMGDKDADKFGELIVNRLNRLGINSI